MRPLPSRPIELRGIMRDSAMRWRLDAVELWQGLDCLGEVSAQWLSEMIAHRLADIALSSSLQHELRGEPPARKALPVAEDEAESHKVVGPPPRQIRERRRVARNANRGRRSRSL